eukprot:CAMPEP_0172382486 /NCGR_PEP_ID=MMETSP1061-20121228/441_1 /TAXON_ID=37318 /ORGANISM="Pseudo-nitzschia pungens, Strain cf. pungens" /LENGTH=95 /DNA_ID=CAMNT_0013110387 /DNA_START=173 /DNA_END=460 /DNA_ORIENTATION=+
MHQTDCLFIGKRRGKEQDQGSKGSNSEDREEVSSEVADTGGKNLGRGDLVGEFGNGVVHELRGINHRGNSVVGDRGESRSNGDAQSEDEKSSVHG